MRSTASYKGHPLHPALIPFPFAFLTGALLFDAAGWILGEPSFTATSRYLTWAGIAAGLLAAVPGIIDYRRTVPPDSSGKRRARTHGLLNTTALVLFGISLAVRGGDAYPVPAALVFEVAGAAALGYAGWEAGQLEDEMAQNAWLSVPADDRLMFSTPLEQRWHEAGRLLGVNLLNLSFDAGRA